MSYKKAIEDVYKTIDKVKDNFNLACWQITPAEFITTLKARIAELTEEDKCNICGHDKHMHSKNGCNHGRYGRLAYPCLCYCFKKKEVVSL